MPVKEKSIKKKLDEMHISLPARFRFCLVKDEKGFSIVLDTVRKTCKLENVKLDTVKPLFLDEKTIGTCIEVGDYDNYKKLNDRLNYLIKNWIPKKQNEVKE